MTNKTRKQELILPPPELIAAETANDSAPATSEPEVPEIHISPRSVKRSVEAHHESGMRHLNAATFHIYLAGITLVAARQGMSRKAWGRLLRSTFGDGKSTVSIRMCQRYMEVAEKIAIIAERRGITISTTRVSLNEAARILDGLSLRAALQLTSTEHDVNVTDLENEQVPENEEVETLPPEPSPNDWLTPQWLTAPLLKFWQGIDLDPCCENLEQPNIPASVCYSCLENGLAPDLPWRGNTFINPGQAGDLRPWVERADREFRAARIREAVLLLPAVTDANWADLIQPYPRAFLHERLSVMFVGTSKTVAPLTHPAMLIFLGSTERLTDFAEHFGVLADIYQPFSFPTSR